MRRSAGTPRRRRPSLPSSKIMELTNTQTEFIEWLTDPMRDGTKREWAREHDVTDRTLRNWEQTATFKDVLQKKLDTLNLSEERIGAAVNKLYEKGMEGDVRALERYIDYADEVAPRRLRNEDESVEALSDEELATELRAAADLLLSK